MATMPVYQQHALLSVLYMIIIYLSKTHCNRLLRKICARGTSIGHIALETDSQRQSYPS